MKENLPPQHSISDHSGILGVAEKGERVEIAFDPAQITESELRKIAARHLTAEPIPFTEGRRWVMRLDGQACEAAAAKLEKRIEKVPGVRRASATYIGHVLCLTCDTPPTTGVLDAVKAAGAVVHPLEPHATPRPAWTTRILAGDWNDEIACALGLATLVAAAAAERIAGAGAMPATLFFLSYVFGGAQGVRSALASLRERTLDIDFLMVLAALGAAAVGAPFEGALLLFLFSFSNVLQSHALRRTQRAIEALLTLRPDHALRKTGEGVESVPITSLVIGDVVIVRPGELLPADGMVTEGTSMVNEASLTGESLPVERTIGAEVFAGTLNQSGGLEVRVGRTAQNSTLAKMVELVAQAQAEKSTTQRFLEKAEQRYAAGVILFTLLVLGIPWLLHGEAFASAFYRAITVMVVASPCALIISTPATVLSAIGGAARRGILIKGGSHLETAARTEIACFDKTGTLTHGKPTVTHVITADASAPPDRLPPEAGTFLRICASVETKSEHPLAQAIVTTARNTGREAAPATDFQAVAGKGAEATVEGARWVVGSERYFRELEAHGMSALTESVAPLLALGETCVWLGRRDNDRVEALAAFALADTLRPEAPALMESLRSAGVKKIVMLTGDHAAVAQAIAAQAGVDEFRAQLLPADKVRAIRQLRAEGTVMMVGDGVNDAPALAAAHLGVALGGSGTDVAMETADVVLMGDRLENCAALIATARKARRVLTQNLTFALCVILALVAAALGLALPLPLGVIGHEGSTILVCLNGLRLLLDQTPPPHKPA